MEEMSPVSVVSRMMPAADHKKETWRNVENEWYQLMACSLDSCQGRETLMRMSGIN